MPGLNSYRKYIIHTRLRLRYTRLKNPTTRTVTSNGSDLQTPAPAFSDQPRSSLLHHSFIQSKEPIAIPTLQLTPLISPAQSLATQPRHPNKQRPIQPLYPFQTSLPCRRTPLLSTLIRARIVPGRTASIPPPKLHQRPLRLTQMFVRMHQRVLRDPEPPISSGLECLLWACFAAYADGDVGAREGRGRRSGWCGRSEILRGV